MEKEKLSEQLRAGVGTTSMSPQTWDAYVDSLIPDIPSDEAKLPDFISRKIEYLKSHSGQYNKDIADRVNAAKKELETKVQIPPIDPKTAKVEIPKNEDTPQWAIDLQKKMETLETERSNEARVLKQKQLLSAVTSKVKELGADNEDLLEMVIGSTQFAENASEDDCIKQVKAKYDEKYSKLYGEGVRPAGIGTPMKPSGKINAETQKIKDKMAEERKKMRV